ncbi:heterokaryon incompatibility, partial [Lasiosphaeria miniovina]
FVALSYCAGDPSDTVPVLIDGQEFNTFRPLGTALRSLLWSMGRGDASWELEDTLFFWADQICINQSDSAEKASQVRMMCRVYEACAWAYGWLG